MKRPVKTRTDKDGDHPPDKQADAITKLSALIHAHDTALQKMLAEHLQHARDTGDTWYIEHAFWVAKHLRGRAGYANACMDVAEALCDLVRQKVGMET